MPLKGDHRDSKPVDGSFGDILRAQRTTLEAKRSRLTQAIAAVAAAETALRSGSAVNTELFRRIIEVIHMGASHEETIAKYTAMLKAKVAHISALSIEQRALLQQQWLQLAEEIKSALHDDPAGPKPQSLLARWASLLQAAGRLSTR